MSTQIRQILFRRISAIESDLRNFIRENLPDSFLEDENIASRVKKRYLREKGADSNGGLELVDFLDFGDTYQILLSKKDELRKDIVKELLKHRKDLESIASIRNRVMHVRPLEADDYYTVDNFVQKVSGNIWPESRKSSKISDLDPTITKIKKEEEDRICHNLPYSDFDETGFIGRKKDVQELKDLLYTEYPRIITLFGEGGVGKTALMLKTAYEIIDDERCPFGYVVWVTCKTKVLTNNGIEEIESAIKNFKSMTQKIDSNFRNAPQTTTLDEITESILRDTKEVKTLLILDNFETIQLQKEVKDFLYKYTQFGKVAITSRMKLGEQDLPRRLEPMTKQEAGKLLRDFARLLNVEILYKLNPEKIEKYAKELSLNPLGIKWFVQSVASGSSPDDVINNKDILLDYCLSNVYKKLSDEQRAFLHVILVNRKPTSKEELLFYTERENDIRVDESLQKLETTSFIRINYAEDADEYLYDITDFAREYVVKKDPPNEELYKEIREKQNKASGLRENMRRKRLYETSCIEIRKESESFLAIKLDEALKYSAEARSKKPPKTPEAKEELHEKATKKAKEVQEIQPRYVEAYRISAFIYVQRRNNAAAESEYQKALEIEPKNPRILYGYAGFLLRYLNSPEKAKEYAVEAFYVDEKSFATRQLYAKCVGILGEYDRAIEILKKLIDEEHSRREKNIALTDAVDFYKRKVQLKNYTERDYREAWNVFLEGVSFFEETQEKFKPDAEAKQVLVELLLGGMQCREDIEISKLKKLIEAYIEPIRKHREGVRLEEWHHSNSVIEKI